MMVSEQVLADLDKAEDRLKEAGQRAAKMIRETPITDEATLIKLHDIVGPLLSALILVREARRHIK